MARKRFIEGRWACTSCDTQKIKGRHKTCPACGNPRENAESDFDFGGTTASGASTQATVTDAALLQLANAGEDWMCLNCDASNPGNRDVCRTCAASRDDPFGEPVYEAVDMPNRKKRGLAGLIAAGGAALASAVGVIGGCCGLSWYASDATVDAEVSAMQWVRQSEVQRLTPSDVTAWRDALPALGGVPGSGSLSAGLGQIYECETLACWPRAPIGGTVVRVTGQEWTRTIQTQIMDRASESGWRNEAPGSRGSMPRNGTGGTPGHDNLSCSEREKTPEVCRDESYQEACGTHEECTVRDLGNGFAEETCVDVQDYCTEYREVCTPAVMGEWCSWTRLSWKPGRERTTSGRDKRPSWPLISLASDEAERRTEQYSLEADGLSGRPAVRLSVPEEVYMEAQVGRLMYSSSLGVQPVPDALQTSETDRHHCGDGIPFDVLTTRDRCHAQVYSWVDEEPLQTFGTSGAPDWPDGQLGNDGRETRTEWMLVELGWNRGNKVGYAVMKDPTDRWQAWQAVKTVPVVVDFDATLVSLDESYEGPIPSEVRPGRISREP